MTEILFLIVLFFAVYLSFTLLVNLICSAVEGSVFGIVAIGAMGVMIWSFTSWFLATT